MGRMRTAPLGHLPSTPPTWPRPRRLPGPELGVLLLASGLLGACGGNTDAMKREISSLREQVTTLQGAQDHLEERLMAMEVQRSQARSERAAEAVEEEQDERPRLKVVRLHPSESGGDGAWDEADEAPVRASEATQAKK